ncbi:MAG: tRNA uridine-5-carboxymethylaminomethyl(34) synthesis GTPase MnmE [Gammaproteobacteria bacterium TMED234]|nr:MAG: tRNA uridine-5-carboxymethylaminomethyl(34) synthesis GTPase MnmE [Gammaproteobacteria bacterium TMED234]
MSVVFALATPPAKSAICVFRVTGDGCHKSLKKIFSRSSFTPNRFYVEILQSKRGAIDKVGVVVFKGPKSYTGEDSFEVHAHGGLAVMSEIVDLFRDLGFDEAAGGEFTKRAFLNNKITLDEAEAVSDIIDSTDRRGVVLSNGVMFGGFSEKVLIFSEGIDSIRVRVEGEIDFSDEGNDYFDESLVRDLESLMVDFSLFVGACVNKKISGEKNNIVLVGPVNSGKSSTFNRLLGFERSIVSETPGTTRDMISSELFFESNVFNVVDTAGVRETFDAIEKRGIDISISEIKNSDLVLGVFEGGDIHSVDFFKKLCGEKKFISIQNKIDVDLANNGGFDCCVSAKTGVGFDVLIKMINDNFKPNAMKKNHKYLIKDRHEKLFRSVSKDLQKAIDGFKSNTSLELVAEDLKNARSHLDEVVGVKFSDSLLGDIFESFCIGK